MDLRHTLSLVYVLAYVCETCGRRFGVASNLNRHVRRCLLRPVNLALTTGASLTTPPAGAGTQDMPATSPRTDVVTHTPGASSAPIDFPVPATSQSKGKRARASSPSPPETSNRSDQQQQQPRTSPETKQRVAKRRRRAPSPSQWIPFSLLAFDLNPIESHKSTPVPLPPVTPSPVEERDSWDENVGAAPYREHWSGKLPGPGLGIGLGKRDVGNLGGTSGYFMGRLSLF